MSNKRLLARSFLFVLPVAFIVGACETTPNEEQSARIDGAVSSAQEARNMSQQALSEVGKLRSDVADAKQEAQRAAEAAERAATAAERAAEEAKAAADKADRIFQRQMRK